MLVLKAILEFDVRVLVNEAGIFVNGYNGKLSKFGVDALNNGQNVWRKRLIETILHWFVNFTHLKLFGVKFLWFISFFFMSNYLFDLFLTILSSNYNIDTLGQDRNNAIIISWPVNMESNAALR